MHLLKSSTRPTLSRVQGLLYYNNVVKINHHTIKNLSLCNPWNPFHLYVIPFNKRSVPENEFLVLFQRTRRDELTYLHTQSCLTQNGCHKPLSRFMYFALMTFWSRTPKTKRKKTKRSCKWPSTMSTESRSETSEPVSYQIICGRKYILLKFGYSASHIRLSGQFCMTEQYRIVFL